MLSVCSKCLLFVVVFVKVLLRSHKTYLSMKLLLLVEVVLNVGVYNLFAAVASLCCCGAENANLTIFSG